MDSLFGKTLTDVVKSSRNVSPQDQLTFLTSLTQDVKNDFKNKADIVKQQALLKLFFLAMEGSDVKWAEFTVINSMGSPDYITKRLAFLSIHLVLDSQSHGLIMVTNLFKKELSNVQNLVQLSTALSCVGNICNKDLSESIIQLIVNLTTHSKSLIRKKSLAVLAKIFSLCPHLIPINLEKVIHKLATEETSANVLACGVSIMTQVLKVTPSLYPLFVKFIFDQLQKQKSNWLIIKLIRISNRIMQIEPRFQKKLIEPITKLLSQTHSKSLQFELIYSIMRYFQDQKTLFESASEVLRTFIDHSDANLRSLGLDCLTQMLQTSSKSLIDFQDQLQDSFEKGDFFYKIQIMQLFREYTTVKNYPQIIEFFLKAIHKEADGQIRVKIIESIIFISQRDKFSNIDDPEQLFLIHIPSIITKVEQHDTAQKLKELIFDLLTRVPDLYHYSDQFCQSVFNSFESKEIFDNTISTTFRVIRGQGVKKDISPRETLCKTLFLIASESARFQQLPQLIQNILMVSNLQLLDFCENSVSEIHSMLFKIIVCISNLMKSPLENYESVDQVIYLNQENQQDKKRCLLNWVFFKKLHRIEPTKTLNIYQRVIFQTLNLLNPDFFTKLLPSLKEKHEIEISQCKNLIIDSDNFVDSFANLNKFFEQALVPIHKDAQKYIKLQEGLDLTIAFDVEILEVQLIKNVNDSQHQDQIPVQTISFQQEQIFQKNEVDKLDQVANVNLINPNFIQSKEQLPTKKKDLIVNKQELLPPGVSQQDLIQDDHD